LKNWLKRWLPWLFLLVVTLSWDASPSAGVVGYRVYGAESLDATKFRMIADVGNVLRTTIPSSGASCFAVTAYDGSGNESALSNVVCTQIQNFKFEVR